MIPIEMGIDLKLVMQGTNYVLILLEQVLKILVVLTSSWHVWRRHMLLRHMLLRLLALGLIFIISDIHILFLRSFFPDHHFIPAPGHCRKFF